MGSFAGAGGGLTLCAAEMLLLSGRPMITAALAAEENHPFCLFDVWVVAPLHFGGFSAGV